MTKSVFGRPPPIGAWRFFWGLQATPLYSFKLTHIICIGDLNYDLLKTEKCRPLTNICDNFYLENIIKNPTCCMKNNTPTLTDVVRTNSKKLLCNTINLNCGLSDCHNMICTNLKEQCDPVMKKKVIFRSYKIFDEQQFNDDLSRVPFHVAQIFDDIDDVYWAHELLLRQVIDEHAPIKGKYPKKKSPAYMNSNYRRTIYKLDKPKMLSLEINQHKIGKIT